MHVESLVKMTDHLVTSTKTDRQTQTDRQTDKQAGRQADKPPATHTDMLGILQVQKLSTRPDFTIFTKVDKSFLW